MPFIIDHALSNKVYDLKTDSGKKEYKCNSHLCRGWSAKFRAGVMWCPLRIRMLFTLLLQSSYTENYILD